MTTRFKNALDALVYAFFNDTLAKGDCAACAVGNICDWSYGYKKKSPLDSYEIAEGNTTDDWGYLLFKGGKVDKGLKAISKTGYSLDEIIKIEKAFESNTNIDFVKYRFKSSDEIMQDQYNGLCAVVDVLCELEGIEDPTEYKELFAIPV